MELSMETPADLLALIPTVMERKPEDMAVIVCFKDERLMCLMGIEHCRDNDMANYVKAILEQMAEVKPDAMTMVYYTEDESECDHAPHEHTDILVRVAIGALTPMDTLPGIVVKGGRFHVYGSDRWHDIDEVKQSEVAAGLVLNGIPLQPEGVVIPEPTGLTERLASLIAYEEAIIPDFPERMQDTWNLQHVQELRGLYADMLGRGFGATEAEAARLVAAMMHPPLRDRLMVDTISHTDNLMQFGETITGLSDALPDFDRLRAGLSLMDNLMQYTDNEHRLPVLVTCAWFHWMLGRAMDARTYCEAALAVDPDYRMAQAFLRYVTELLRIPVSVLHRERGEA